MAIQGGTVIVPAGAVSAIVLGAFDLAALYEVGLTPGWVTGFRITGKTATQFTVDFAVPAPVGGSSIDWLVLTGVSTGFVRGAVVPIAAGLTTIAVLGSFATSYEVLVAPGWVTDVDVVGKTAAGFTINFGTPAPAGGSTLDWIALLSVGTAGSTQSPLGATVA